MASLWTRVKSLFATDKTAAPATGEIIEYPPGKFVAPWQKFDNRKDMEKDLQNMDENDSLVSSALDIIAEFATCFDDTSTFGFRVELEEPARADGVTKEEEDALDLMRGTSQKAGLQGTQCWDLARDMVLKGNVFGEVKFDDKLQVAQIQQFPQSWQISKNVDQRGNLKSGDPQAALKDPKTKFDAAYTQINDMGNAVAAFWPYQIVHWQFGAGGGKVYCKPMLSPFIKDWKKLRAEEDALAVARLTTAWSTNVHKILVPAGASPEEVRQKIDEYRKSIEQDKIPTYDSTNERFYQSYRATPINVGTDFYVISYYTSDGRIVSGEVQKLQPSTAALDNINDIYWGVARLQAILRVPADYMGLKVGQRAFIDKTSEKGLEAFSKFVKRLQACHAYGVKQILDMQLLLSGFNPLDIQYKLVYPAIVPQSAEMSTRIILNRAQAGTYWQDMGIPNELIGKHVLDFTPQEIEQWQSSFKDKVAQTVPPKKPDKPGQQPPMNRPGDKNE